MEKIKLILKGIDYLLLLPLLAKLPLPVAYFIARFRGRFKQKLNRKLDTIIRHNIGKVLGIPEGKSKEISRKLFENHSQEELDILILPKISGRYIKDHVSFKGMEFLTLEKKGKGVILIGCHLGSLPVFTVVVGMMGYRVNAIASSYGPPYNDIVYTKHIDARIKNIGEKMNGEFLFIGQFNGSIIKKILKGNEILIILQDAKLGNSHCLPTQFLGREAFFPYSAFRLARITGASIVPFSIIRKKTGFDFSVEFFPPIFLPKDRRDLEVESFQRTMGNFSEIILKNPADWCYILSPASWANLDKI